MTNEYKLAPSVPTDEILDAGYKYGENIGVFDATMEGRYIAMLQDAPTLVAVNLNGMKKHLNNPTFDDPDEMPIELEAYNNGYNQAIADIQKHGKIYAVKGE